MTYISLIDFFRTGNFGPIRLGMTRQEVYDILGEPDFYDSGFRECSHSELSLMDAEIWSYCPIEFYFFLDSPLFMVFTDHIPFEDWRESNIIELDAWLFSNGNQPSRAELEAGLAEHHISYTYLESEKSNAEHVTGKLILASGVEIAVADVCGKQKISRRRKAVYLRRRDLVVFIQMGSSQNL